jgi:serine protease Do
MQQLKGDGIVILQSTKQKTQGQDASSRKRSLVALGCAGAMALALVGGAGVNVWQSQPALAQDLSRAPLTFADVAEKVRPAVVSIFTKGTSSGPVQNFQMPDIPEDSPFYDFFDQFRRNFPEGQQPQPRLEQAQGSGFLISADGYVVTNSHVVDNATDISVTFESEEEFTAKVIGTDQRTDLALLKIESDKPFETFLTFSAVEPRVGDWVLAVGNPFGLGGTVTAGIISAGGRSIGSGPYDFIQIDAAVNRGNSGGPAVNLDGEVIGVNTAIFSPSGGNVGIAFAIPSGLAQKVITELRDNGKVNRGWLGVSIQDVSKDIAESLGITEAKGAMITRILEDGPSEGSALKVRDVVIQVNGEEIANSRDLARKVAELAPDTDASLVVIRDGTETPITIKLGTFPASDQLAALSGEQAPSADGDETMKELGLSLAPASEIEGAGESGVAITGVDPVSEAAEKGLNTGDVIVEVGGVKVSTPGEVASGIREAGEKGRKAVLLQVQSNRETRFVALSLDVKDN